MTILFYDKQYWLVAHITVAANQHQHKQMQFAMLSAAATFVLYVNICDLAQRMQAFNFKNVKGLGCCTRCQQEMPAVPC